MNKIQTINNYNKFYKLNQLLITIILKISQAFTEIRSKDILHVLTIFGTEVTESWINQIRAREGLSAPEGRPTLEYIARRQQYHHDMKEIIIKEVSSIGIPLFQSLLKHYEITQMLVRDIQKAQLESEQKIIGGKSLENMLESFVAMILNPKAHNFLEAERMNIEYVKMSFSHAQEILKDFEGLDNLPEILDDSFIEYWAKTFKLLEPDKKITVFIDPHIKPYFTKESALCGKISGSQRIMPGTKHLISCIEGGYIISLRNIRVDLPLSEETLKLADKLKSILGDNLQLFIIDREGCGKDFNKKLSDLGIGVLTFLRSNQYKGREDFNLDKLDDGIYAGYWMDERKRAEDNRAFLFIEEPYDNYVIAVTHPEKVDDPLIEYKARWVNNEDTIKLLVNHLDFNVNICNGTYEIENPKIEKKIPELDKKIKNQQDMIEKGAGKLSVKERKKKINKDRQEKEKILKHPKLKVRNVIPDLFMSILKSHIFNLLFMLFDKFIPKDGNKKTRFEDSLQLLINGNGNIVYGNNLVEYWYKPPISSKDFSKMKKFCNAINKLNVKDDKKRLIKCYVGLRGS